MEEDSENKAWHVESSKELVASARWAARMQSLQSLSVATKEVMFFKWQRHLQHS